MALVNSPPNTPVDTQDEEGRLRPPSEGWRNFFNAVFNICNAVTMSGTTAQRPVSFLFAGRVFYDTTIGLPIWYDGAAWRDAAGNPV